MSKEEFTSDAIKPIIEKWVSGIEDWDAGMLVSIFKAQMSSTLALFLEW